MTIGQYEGSVGNGYRTSFPKKFRQLLGDRLILTKGLDGNIIIVGEQDGALLTEGIETRPFTNTKARELQAYILGNAYEVELDGIGRFVIPEYLRIHAGIGKKVIFAGISQYIQLWDKDRFLNYQKRLERIIRENAEELPGKE